MANSVNFEAQKIRSQYVERESTELDRLKALDKKVSLPVNVFAYAFGSVSAIVMGAGMSLVMTDIGATLGIATPLIPGIIIGIVGLGLSVVNYPLYKKILKNRRRKYKDEIIKLSEQMINN